MAGACRRACVGQHRFIKCYPASPTGDWNQRCFASERSAHAKPVPDGEQYIDLTVGGMNGAHCPPVPEKAIGAMDGVSEAHVNLANKRAAIDYDPGCVKVAGLVNAIRGIGYSADADTIRIPIKPCILESRHE